MKKLITVTIFLILSACSPSPATPMTDIAIPLPAPITATQTPQPSETVAPTIIDAPTFTPEPTTTSLPIGAPTVTDVFMPLLEPTQAHLPKLRMGQLVILTSLHMMDAKIGWGLGNSGHILHTEDGGLTWQDVTPPEGSFMSGGFFASDSKTAWATFFTGLYTPISSAFVWYTSDGGQSWQASQPFPTNLDTEGKAVPVDYYQPKQLYFLDGQTGWLLVDVYYGMHSTRLLLFRTQDGGKTWTIINDHYHNLQKAAGIGVAFANQEMGWYGQNDIRFQWISLRIDEIVATGGWKLPKTLDGGRSFAEFTLLPLPAELQKPEFAGKSADCGETRMLTIAPGVIGVEWTCWIYTEPRQDLSFYALTNDGGQSWHSWLATGNESFLHAKTGWRLSTSKVLQQTTDGGRTWLPIKAVTWQAAQFNFVSEQIGWAIVKSGDATALVHTTNGGQVWEEIRPVIAP